MKISKIKQTGFTLLEVLIALFIFTIVSMLMMGGLHTIINAATGTERNAQRLREMQITLLMISRDIEQAINRPVLNPTGKEEPAFVGTPRNFVFTHMGFANTNYLATRSTLQRTRYEWHDHVLSRLNSPVLDEVTSAKTHPRILLNNLTTAHFQYLDNKGHFYNNWPVEGLTDQPLPRAVRISLTITDWGSINQLYLISAKSLKPNAQPQT